MSYSEFIPKSCRGQPVKLPDGKVVGYLEGSVFIKPVVGSRHMLRTPRAWAIDAELYEQVRPSIERIVIEDKETGTRYQATTEVFDRFRGVLDRGFGKQYYLTLNRWMTGHPGDVQQLALTFG
jgi:hypothetical protein